MNTVDAYCQNHNKVFRWLTGSPRWCDLCREEQRVQQLQKGVSSAQGSKTNGKDSDEEVAPTEANGNNI